MGDPHLSPDPDSQPGIPEQVHHACLDAALEAYEDAGIRGLCAEGRWECAVSAIRDLDLRELRRGTSQIVPPRHDPQEDHE